MSRKVKRPAERVPVPQSATAAGIILDEIGRHQREITLAQAAFDETMAAAKALAETGIAPNKARIEVLTRGLQIWAEANRESLTDSGRTKTITLSSGTVSWRQSPPSVTVRGVDAVIEAVRQLELSRFLRTKTEIDREAMLREPAVASTIPGVSIGSAGEAFIVEPAAVPLALTAVA
jgi:phage host-nuclease inhibitor protein Gam